MLDHQQLSFDIDNYESVTVRKRKIQIEKIIESLGLRKHPVENGYSKEIFRSHLHVNYPPASGAKRSFCAGIYYLLSGKDFSPWHRLKNSEEVWMFHSGSTLNIHMISDDGEYVIKKLGNKLSTRDPLTDYQVFIPANTWFACEVTDKTSYCLATITIAPSQESEDFEIKSEEELLSLFPQHVEVIQKFSPKPTSDICGVEKAVDILGEEMTVLDQENSKKAGCEVDSVNEHDGGICHSDTSGNVSNDNDEGSKGGSESEDSEPLSDLSNLGLGERYIGKTSEDQSSGTFDLYDEPNIPKFSRNGCSFVSHRQQRVQKECQDETLRAPTKRSKNISLIMKGER